MKNRWVTVNVVNRHDTRGELAQALAAGAMDEHLVNVVRKNKARLEALVKKPDPES
jgi:hypothetical protein